MSERGNCNCIHVAGDCYDKWVCVACGEEFVPRASIEAELSRLREIELAARSFAVAEQEFNRFMQRTKRRITFHDSDGHSRAEPGRE